MSYDFAETKAAPGAPLIFTFHGTGGDQNQFHGLAAQLVPGAGVISVLGDVSEHGAARFFRRRAEGVYDMEDLARRTENLARFMRDQIARLKPDRVMAFGYSNGANILGSVLIRHPDIVDDTAMLHPLIPWIPEPQPGLAGRRVLVTAGLNDPICPPDQTRQWNGWLTAQGADVNEIWTRGGHGIEQQEVLALRAFLNTAIA